MTKTKTISARALRKKSAARRDSLIARAFNASIRDVDFRIDANGNKVRVTTADRPVTREDVRHCLIRQRAVEIEDLLEQLGEGVTRRLIEMEYIRPVKKLTGKPSLFWVTKKGGENYDLPRPTLFGSQTQVDFVD